jgi:predicted metal-dependent hydrolase
MCLPPAMTPAVTSCLGAAQKTKKKTRAGVFWTMGTAVRHELKARRVQFDFKDTPLHWIPDDPFSTYTFNGVHLLLPAGELWFCRVYSKALLYVTDPQLRADVEGFIRQEAIHSRAHSKAEHYLHAHGIETENFRSKVEWLFEKFLGEAPLGIGFLQNRLLDRHWLVLRVGIVAAIEHFTGLIGQWAMDNTTLDKADPIMADLFRWHLAEEVEHRTVAFDLFQHLCKTQLGFYVSRQALMAIIYPLFLFFLVEGGRSLGQQDPDPAVRKLASYSLPRMLIELERVGRRTQNLPTFSFLTAGTIRWMSPRFHPVTEGNTEQALAYLARSPAARAAAKAS